MEPRSQLELLRDRRFALFVLARAVAALGVWIYAPVAAIEMYRLTGSALWVGLVGVVQFGPQLILGPLCGAWADRGQARLQVVLGYSLAAIGAFLTVPEVGGFLLGNTLGWSEAACLLVGAAVVGVGFSVGGPVTLAMVAEIVPQQDLQAASQLNSVPLLVARAAGPALGAALLVVAGGSVSLVVAGGVNVVATVLMVALRLPRRLSGTSAEGEQGILATVRMVRGKPALLLTLVGIAVVGGGSDPATTLTPTLADRLGAAPEVAGWMTAAFGVGSVMVLPGVTVLRRRLGLFGGAGVGLAVMAGGLAFTAVPHLFGAMAGMFLAGVGMTVAYTYFSILVQVLSPPEMRARVLALWVVAFLGLRPLVSLLSGAGADAIGVGPVVVVLVLPVLAVAALYELRRSSREVVPQEGVALEPVLTECAGAVGVAPSPTPASVKDEEDRY